MTASERYVVLRSKAKPAELTWNDAGQRGRRRLGTGDGKIVLESTELTAREVADLDKDPEVVSCAPVMPFKLHEPTERISEEGLEESEPWGLRAVGATASPFDGAGIKVAVLDTGIDASHEAFRDLNIIQHDFTGEGDGDTDGHGTHCAGTIFGRPVQGLRIGVATGIEQALIAKVIGLNGASTESIIKAIEWSLDNGAHIISMSLGMDFPGFVRRLVKQGYPADLATSKALEGYRENVRLFDSLAAFVRSRSGTLRGALLIAAAGNESRRQHDPRHVITVAPPAAADGIIAVGALALIEGGFAVAPFSNSNPDISAPGVGIVSAQAGGGLARMSGTSMATPHVAGIAALWAQKLQRATRRFSAQSVSQKLTGTSTIETQDGQVSPLDAGLGMVQAPVA